jgi:hypothetical protein
MKLLHAANATVESWLVEKREHAAELNQSVLKRAANFHLGRCLMKKFVGALLRLLLFLKRK